LWAANLARPYSQVGQFEEALTSNWRAIEISEELGDRPGLARDLSSRGHIVAAMGEFERSLDYYYRALAIAQAQATHSPIQKVGVWVPYVGKFTVLLT
jgi:tetratricopeptide (TPR) repeat protein